MRSADSGVGHDGGRVRVRQHHFVALRLERLAGLCAGVIELRGLPDDNGPGTEYRIFEMSVRFGIYRFRPSVTVFTILSGASTKFVPQLQHAA